MNDKASATSIPKEEKLEAANCLLTAAWGIYLQLCDGNAGKAAYAISRNLEDVMAHGQHE